MMILASSPKRECSHRESLTKPSLETTTGRPFFKSDSETSFSHPTMGCPGLNRKSIPGWFLDGFLRADEDSPEPCSKRPLANARNYLNYHRVAGYYRALFGPGNVYVGLFEKLQEDQGAFLSDLAEFMGIDAFSLPEKALKRKENPPLSAVSSGLARYANKKLGNTVVEAAVRRKWLKRADKMLFGLLPAKNAMDDKTRDFVKDHYRPGNKALEANLGLPLGRYGYST